MVPLIGHANIMRYACIQSCRIDVGVVHLMIIRISVQLGPLDVEQKIINGLASNFWSTGISVSLMICIYIIGRPYINTDNL